MLVVEILFILSCLIIQSWKIKVINLSDRLVSYESAYKWQHRLHEIQLERREKREILRKANEIFDSLMNNSSSTFEETSIRELNTIMENMMIIRDNSLLISELQQNLSADLNDWELKYQTFSKEVDEFVREIKLREEVSANQLCYVKNAEKHFRKGFEVLAFNKNRTRRMIGDNYLMSNENKQLTKSLMEELETIGSVLILQHHPTYTLGSATTESCGPFQASSDELPFEVVKSDRGGQITFHGPGQLMVYPILDLEIIGKDINDYLRTLENIIIDVFQCYNVTASTIPGLTGVWVNEVKVAAIGIKISRWITLHGFCLNVNPNMKYFNNIVPCGIKDKDVGSLLQFASSSEPFSMSNLTFTVLNCIQNNLKVDVIDAGIEETAQYVTDDWHD